MAYITTAEVKAIREALKAEFGKRFKFSVRRRDSHAVAVAIISGDTDFSDIWSDREPGDYGYGYSQINTYHTHHYGDHKALFDRIVEIIKTAPATAEGGREWFDESDSQVDYFHTAYYWDLDVGKWDKAYVMK